jgi:hypothetical protein
MTREGPLAQRTLNKSFFLRTAKGCLKILRQPFAHNPF